MTNQWQFGVYGHAEDADDEIARKCILRVQAEYHCSASAAIKHICGTYAQGIQPVTYAQDNSEVLAAIAELSRKLDNIGVVQAPTESPQSETSAEAEDRLLSTGMSEAALVALKTRVFKPGMRLES